MDYLSSSLPPPTLVVPYHRDPDVTEGHFGGAALHGELPQIDGLAGFHDEAIRLLLAFVETVGQHHVMAPAKAFAEHRLLGRGLEARVVLRTGTKPHLASTISPGAYVVMMGKSCDGGVLGRLEVEDAR